MQLIPPTNLFVALIVPVVFAQTDTLEIQDDSLSIDSTGSDAVIQIDESIPVINRNRSYASLSYPAVENKAFAIGEKFTYKIRYGFIRAGTATMEVKKEILLNDRPCYHIRTQARSAAAFNFIYKVEDVVDSYIDKTGLFSWKFEKRLREGGYKADVLVDYNPIDSLADVSFTRYKGRMKIYKQQNYKVKTPPFIYDILASLYYARTQRMEIGKSIYVTNHDNRKVYELEVKVYRKETIETEAGAFNCLLVEPLLKGEGIFIQKGTLKIWLTDDRFKIPVLMTSEIAVGHITTELEKIEGIKDKIPAMVVNHE